MLNFVKVFFCIYLDYHMVYIFHFVNMVYHIDWFLYIEESLHSWNKPNLVMAYEHFDVLLSSLCSNFLENFYMYVHQWYWHVVFFLCVVFVWFWYQGDGGLLEWILKFSFLCNFLKEFRRIGINSGEGNGSPLQYCCLENPMDRGAW